MLSKPSTILLVISLLMTALIFSSSVMPYGFVKAAVRSPVECHSSTSGGKVTQQCCYDTATATRVYTTCQTCRWTAGNRANFEICDDPVVYGKQTPPPPPPPGTGNANVPPTGGGIVEPGPKTLGNANVPPTSALHSLTKQQTLTTTCPDGSAPDTNGNCPTTTTTNQQGGSTSDNNNNPTSGHHKGSNQPTQTGGGGQEPTTKKHKGSKTDQGTTQPPS